MIVSFFFDIALLQLLNGQNKSLHDCLILRSLMGSVWLIIFFVSNVKICVRLEDDLGTGGWEIRDFILAEE